MNNNDDTSDLQAERDRLQAECMALRVERSTGVPASLLGQGRTEEEMQAIAESALAWKSESRPTPTPTAPTYPVGQISRDSLAYLSPAQILQAQREGRLVHLGVGLPQQVNGQAF